MRRILAAAFLLCSTTAFGHDFWIEPSTFRPAVGQTMTAALRVGQDFVGDAIPRSSQLIDSFTIRDAAGERSISGFENEDPAGILRVERAGVAVIGYRSKANPLELPADKFEAFLRSEGLEAISELRARRGESQKPDRERFYRYAKAVLGEGGFDRRLGYRYEIVAESNSRFRVLFEGKPLPGALVTAIYRDDPAARMSARSDAHGRVTLKLLKPGVWLVKSVYMVPAPAGSNFDWESLWASVTFQR